MKEPCTHSTRWPEPGAAFRLANRAGIVGPLPMPHSLAPTPGPSAPSLVSGEPSIERRLRVLRSLAVLDSEPEESFDGLTQAACAIAGFPVALMALADADRLWFKSRVGWPSPEIALTSSAFCWHVLTLSLIHISEPTRPY